MLIPYRPISLQPNQLIHVTVLGRVLGKNIFCFVILDIKYDGAGLAGTHGGKLKYHNKRNGGLDSKPRPSAQMNFFVKASTYKDSHELLLTSVLTMTFIKV